MGENSADQNLLIREQLMQLDPQSQPGPEHHEPLWVPGLAKDLARPSTGSWLSSERANTGSQEKTGITCRHVQHIEHRPMHCASVCICSMFGYKNLHPKDFYTKTMSL